MPFRVQWDGKRKAYKLSLDMLHEEAGTRPLNRKKRKLEKEEAAGEDAGEAEEAGRGAEEAGEVEEELEDEEVEAGAAEEQAQEDC